MPLIARLRQDPGRVLLAIALAGAAFLYLPVLRYGLVNHDDFWLVRDNFLLADVSRSTLSKVFFDTSAVTRFTLGAEYLPIRDISVMLDNALWGDWYGGHHLTSLAIYLGGLVIWFRALVELGVERKTAGLAMLIWALLPAHAESVAWVSERKGLLAVGFAGVATLGYARFRCGRGATLVVLAMVGTVCAIWSKAPAAFAVAALAPLELVVSQPRASWRRALLGLACIAVAGGLALVPVVVTATNLAAVDSVSHAPAGWLAMPLGLNGFYTQLSLMLFRNAVSYPIKSLGPSTLDIVVGAIALGCALTLILVPARGRWRPAPPLRIAAVIWLAGIAPASRIGLSLRAVLVNDRYVLFATLGVALAAATGLLAIRSTRARNALVGALLVAAGLRTLDARSNWSDSATLWERATVSNPRDGDAWNAYVGELFERGERAQAFVALREALRHTRSPRLLLREAIVVLEYGKHDKGVELMMEAASGGEPRAMANLAVLLSQDGHGEQALMWARKAVLVAPMYARGHRALGEVALSQGKLLEALLALQRAHALSPIDLPTRYMLASALIELHQPEQARPHLEACIRDIKYGQACRDLLDQLRT